MHTLSLMAGVVVIGFLLILFIWALDCFLGVSSKRRRVKELRSRSRNFYLSAAYALGTPGVSLNAVMLLRTTGRELEKEAQALERSKV